MPIDWSSQVQSPAKQLLLNTRGTTNAQPTPQDRGLSGVKPVRYESALEKWASQRGAALDFIPQYGSPQQPRPTQKERGLASSSNPSEFLRELSALQVQGMFAMKRPANVSAKDLTENDAIFRGRGAPMATFISKTAHRFGIPPALLAEHLIAEQTAFARLAQVPTNATLAEYLKVTRAFTSEMGLDDFVRDRKSIETAIPSAKSISRGRASSPIAAEAALSELRKALERGAPQAEIDKFMKPQLELPLGDAIAASAAVLRFKTERAKRYIPEFDNLPTEIQFQLVRLFVNPPSGKNNPKGINYIIREANAGRYMNLFDFSDRTAHEANDPSKAKDVYRRATIHTARAIHFDQEVLDDE